jgi:hypothetical protein
MDASYVWNWKDLVQTILYGFQACGVVAAVLIYLHQRKASLASERQANRARLTEAYMLWHSEVLKIENSSMAANMMRRSHGILARGDVSLSIEDVRRLHYLYLLLNALFLEWNYRNTYYPKDKVKEGFYATVRTALHGLATNPLPEYKRFVTHFRELFSDFPEDFKDAIWKTIEQCQKDELRPQSSDSSSPSAPWRGA